MKKIDEKLRGLGADIQRVYKPDANEMELLAADKY